MKKYILVLICFFLIVKYHYGQTPPLDENWELIFSDEFNYTDINDFNAHQTIWTVINNNDHYGEPCVSTNRPENVFIDNGNLVIRAINESYSCPPEYLAPWHCLNQDHNYTSGWVETNSQYYIQYGYLEAEIKLPYEYGLWPAFWAYIGNDIVNASNAAEIDIFEMIGAKPTSTVMGTNLHLDYCPIDEPHNQCNAYPAYYEFICDGIPCFGQDVNIPSYESYLKYAIEWSPTKIIWYVNGKVVRNYFNPGIIDPVKIILGMGIDPYHLPNTSTNFPADMYINYLRVYKTVQDCDNVINSCYYDFTSNDNVVKNVIKIGEYGCINSVPENTNVNLRASQFVEIQGDFYVPLGASLYADANDDCPNTLSLECTNVFNPCTFDFINYDNSIKRLIVLGGDNCPVVITPSQNNISLEATEKIELKSGVNVIAIPGKKTALKIVPCQ